MSYSLDIVVEHGRFFCASEAYLLLKNIVTTHIDDTKEKKLCSKEVSVSKNY